MAFTLWYRRGGSADEWQPFVATDDETGARFSYFYQLGYTSSRLWLHGVTASGGGDLYDPEVRLVAEDLEFGILPLPVRDWGDIEGTYPFEGKFEFTRLRH